MVDSLNVEGYTPRQGYAPETKEALIDFNTDSELWLISLPLSPKDKTKKSEETDWLDEIDGKELTFNLPSDGKLAASFKGSSANEYEFVNSLEPNEVVFVSSTTQPKIAAISRRVSVVHYPDPKELEKRKSTQIFSGGSTMTTTQSVNPRSFQSSKGSRKSTLSHFSEPPNASEKRSMSKSGMVSGLSSEHSHEGKTKRRKYKE